MRCQDGAGQPLTDAQAEALRDWMGRSSSHRDELTRVFRFWKQANVLTELAVPLRRHSPRSVPPSDPKTGQLLAMACVLLALAVLVGWWGSQRLDRAANSIDTTAVGQQRTVGLPDAG